MQKTTWKKALNILACGLVGATILIAGCGDSKTSAAVAEKTAGKQEQQLSSARNTPIVRAAKKVGPAVVGITNKGYVRDFFNRVYFTDKGTGSGVIYDKAGYIATNNHVVEGASEIIVSLADGRSVKGKVLGADPATDLAVVKIDAKDLTVAEFGDSDTLQVGEPAIAIGNPLGLEFRGSVTVGVISSLNRSIEIGDRKFNLIQTDAAINPGNSGGALLNINGEVIGINTVKVNANAVEGMGYAIPISDASEVITTLMNRETRTKVSEAERGYLGIQGVDVSSDHAKMYNMPMGVYISEIVKGGGAEKAGLEKYMIITGLDGISIDSMTTLKEQLQYYKAGEEVEVTVQVLGSDKEYKEKTVTVTLGEAS